MPSTYTPINSVTITSSTATIAFTSIPQTYTDLILVASNVLQVAGSNGLRIRFNSDSSTNYSDTELKSNGTTASTQRETNTTSGYAGATSYSTTVPGHAICHIMNYSNTTVHKTLISRSSVPTTDVLLTIGYWRNTTSITRIDLAMGGTFPAENFASGVFTLYGIKAA